MNPLARAALAAIRAVNEAAVRPAIALYDFAADLLARRLLGRYTVLRAILHVALAALLARGLGAAALWAFPPPGDAPGWARIVARPGGAFAAAAALLLPPLALLPSLAAPLLRPLGLLLLPLIPLAALLTATLRILLRPFASGFEWSVAIRYLQSRRKTDYLNLITAISVGGVAVGVTALIVVIAVMGGFERDLKAKILGTSAHIVIAKAEGDFTDYESAARTAEAAEGVVAAAPFVDSQAILARGEIASSAAVRGVDPEKLPRISPLLARMHRGSIEALGARSRTDPEEAFVPAICIGKELARELGAFVGDRVDVISPFGVQTPLGPKPRVRAFEVAGVFESGLYEFDSGHAYVSLAEAQDFFDFEGSVSGVEARVSDASDARDVRDALAAALPEGYSVRDWGDMNRALFSALQLEKLAMFVVLTLIVLVAAFNIATTLAMVVMDKRRDIAVLKTLGATAPSIRRIFALEGLLIGLLGTALGAALGIGCCAALARWEFIRLPADVFYNLKLPVALAWGDVAAILAAAAAITVVATLYPSRQAARFMPADVFRKP